MQMNWMTEAQFQIRSRYLGKIKARFSSPVLPQEEQLKEEIHYYQILLEAGILKDEASVLTHVIDVGCRNWSYVSALTDYFPKADLVGVEVDGARRYWNLHRRIDYAKAFAKRVGDSRCRRIEALHLDFLDLSHDQVMTQDVFHPQLLFCFFYPFVSEHPCSQWGLPKRFVNFTGLLHHARKISEEAQVPFRVLSVHQGEWERELALSSYQSLGLKPKEQCIQAWKTQNLWPSPYDAWVLVV